MPRRELQPLRAAHVGHPRFHGLVAALLQVRDAVAVLVAQLGQEGDLLSKAGHGVHRAGTSGLEQLHVQAGGVDEPPARVHEQHALPAVGVQPRVHASEDELDDALRGVVRGNRLHRERPRRQRAGDVTEGEGQPQVLRNHVEDW